MSRSCKRSIKQKVTIKVDDDSIALLYKPRCAPFQYGCHGNEEPANFECGGIIERSDHSEWACPVGPVIKPSGKIQLCAVIILINDQLIHENNNVTLVNSRLRSREHFRRQSVFRVLNAQRIFATPVM